MDGMSGMDMGSECSMSMLGNWQVIGSCFLTSSWHVTTEAQFAGSVIGVFLIVVLIESVRRWGREYDQYLIRRRIAINKERRQARQTPSDAETAAAKRPSDCESQDGEIQVLPTQSKENATQGPRGAATLSKIENAFFGLPRDSPGARALRADAPLPLFRPTMFQQMIRSLIYGVQFAGAYLVMLIAMSYNGYILIAIVLGGIFGHFFSSWDTLAMQLENEEDTMLMGQNSTTGQPRVVSTRSQAAYGNVSGACCD